MSSRVKKPPFIRELTSVDISALRDMVMRTSDKVWNVEDEKKENNFECFDHTRHIIFRFIEGLRDHRNYYSNPIWSVWKDHLIPIFEDVIKPYGFTHPVYPKVMLARLQAGCEIDPHRDGEGPHLRTHKIHIPLQTNQKTLMYINDQPFHLKEGTAYEVNNIVPHSVENLGETDRIHLIFEVFEQTQ